MNVNIKYLFNELNIGFIISLILASIILGAFIAVENTVFYILVVGIIIIFLLIISILNENFLYGLAIFITPFHAVFLIKTTFMDVRISQIIWVILLIKALLSHRKTFLKPSYLPKQLIYPIIIFGIFEWVLLPFSSNVFISLREAIQSFYHIILFLFIIFSFSNYSKIEVAVKSILYSFLFSLVIFYSTILLKQYPLPIVILNAKNSLVLNINWGHFVLENFSNSQILVRHSLWGLGFNASGFYIVPIVLILFAKLLTKNLKHKLYFVLILITGILTLFLTGSRSPLLALSFGIIVIIICLGKIRYFFITPILLGLYIIIDHFFPLIFSRLENLKNIGSDQTTQHRFAIWKYAISKFIDKPLTGWGSSYIESQNILLENQLGGYIPTSNNVHNFLIQIAAEQGFISLLLILLFLFNIFIYIYRNILVVNTVDKITLFGVLGAFFSIILMGLTMNIFNSDLFWMYLGIICSLVYVISMKTKGGLGNVEKNENEVKPLRKYH